MPARCTTDDIEREVGEARTEDPQTSTVPQTPHARAGRTVCTFAYLLMPAFSRIVNLWFFDTPMLLFDIVLSFWLLFRGLHPGLSHLQSLSFIQH